MGLCSLLHPRSSPCVIGLGLPYKAPWLGLKQQECVLSQPGRLNVQGQGVDRVGSF